MDIYISLMARKGPRIVSLFIVLIFYHFEGASCQQVCYVCDHVRDFSSCQQNIRVCQQGEVCFTSQSIHYNGYLVYNSGCVSNQTCETLSSLGGPVKYTTRTPMVLGNIIGKRKRMVSICIRCCDNKGESYRPCNLDRCNSKGTPTTTTTIPLFTSARPTTTTTTPTTTTTTPTSTTNTALATTSCPHGCCDKDPRCNDFTFALKACTDPSRGHLCEKTCGLCSQTPAHTTKPSCIDTDPRCRDFNFVMNVCLDNQRAKTCPKICGLC